MNATVPPRSSPLAVGASLVVLAMLVLGGLAFTPVGREAWELLSGWERLDTWIVVTGGLAAMACALPGNYLVLRRQSMMGDALSHSVLPGIIVAFLVSELMRRAGWLSPSTYAATRYAFLFGGAVLAGLTTALLTELVRTLGRVEASAALGVVFTSEFALGLLLVRLFADNVHLDPDCVLYGMLETVPAGADSVPGPVWVLGGLWLANVVLVVLFYKELKISAFDPRLATTLGIHARTMHYGLMAVTAMTLVAAFESVGSIVVIAMLIAPAASAYLLTDQLSRMLVLSQLLAAASAVLGHGLALTLPPLVFRRLGFPMVDDANTAGMMAVAAGLLFVLAMLFGPRHGVLSRLWVRARLSLRIASDDILGRLYRHEEKESPAVSVSTGRLRAGLTAANWLVAVSLWRLRQEGCLQRAADGYCLTDEGRRRARHLVRSHRLWESYMAKHLSLPDVQMHASAEQVEHFLDAALQDQLADELQTQQDPHGRAIPPS